MVLARRHWTCYTVLADMRVLQPVSSGAQGVAEKNSPVFLHHGLIQR